MSRFVLVAAAIAISLSLAGCSNDELPTKSEFVSQLSEESGGEVDEETAGCIYDRVKDKEELFKAMYNQDSSEESEFVDEFSSITAECLGLGG